MGVQWDKMPKKFRDLVKSVQPRDGKKKTPRNRGTSKLETRFLFLWIDLGGPILEREYRFHPTRKWSADFFHVGSNTIIEIEGVTVQGGRHQRIGGFQEDCEKYLEAVLMGHRVIRLGPKQITTKLIQRIIDLLNANHNSRCHQ